MRRILLVAILIIVIIVLVKYCGEAPELFRPRRVLSDPAHDYDYAYDLPKSTEWDVKSWAHIHPCNSSYVYCNYW